MAPQETDCSVLQRDHDLSSDSPSQGKKGDGLPLQLPSSVGPGVPVAISDVSVWAPVGLMVPCISEGERQETCGMACGRGAVTIAVGHTTLKLNDLEQQSFHLLTIP